MSDGNAAATPGPATAAKPSKILSCVLCQQRKVKCDKKQPCSNCVKAHVQCVPATKAPSRPRKRRAESELIARLRRYEKYMKDHGINIDEESDGDESSDAPEDETPSDSRKPAKPIPSDSTRGKLVIDPETGKSRYIDNHLWAQLSTELDDHTSILNEASEGDQVVEEFLRNARISKNLYENGASLLLGPRDGVLDLSTLHPPPVHIFRLWQTFLDNIYPIVKVFHAPSIQQQVLAASSDIQNTPHDLQALMFSIYSCAVMSMENAECESMVGDSQLNLLAKFHSATQHALMRANFLKSPRISTLQAYILYLISVRMHYDPRALWILTGVSIRIAQRLGLHRDGLDLGLSPFDVQIRRRLWWVIVVLDGRLSEIAGSGISLVESTWDVKPPWNLNDSDLNPEMKEIPVEHRGLTEIAYTMLTCDVGSFLHHRSANSTGFDGYWSKFHGTSIAEKHKMIDQFENMLEERYLRYCDPSIPLHAIVAMSARAVLCKMRLAAYRPQTSTAQKRLTQQEKDALFNVSLKSVEIDNYCQASPNIRRFKWHIMTHFQLDAFVYLISELQNRTTGEVAEKAWSQVEEVYENRRRILDQSETPLFIALGNLTLKAWTRREVAYEKLHPGNMLTIPRYISVLRARKIPTPKPEEQLQQMTLAPSAPISAMAGEQTATGRMFDGTSWQTMDGPWDATLTPETMTLDSSPMDWDYWDGLLQTTVIPMVGSGSSLGHNSPQMPPFSM